MPLPGGSPGYLMLSHLELLSPTPLQPHSGLGAGGASRTQVPSRMRKKHIQAPVFRPSELSDKLNGLSSERGPLFSVFAKHQIGTHECVDISSVGGDQLKMGACYTRSVSHLA